MKRFRPLFTCSSCLTVDEGGLSSSCTRPDCPALCFRLRRLLSIRKFGYHVRSVLGLTTFSESIFRTSHRDVNINETSSYIDLSPLYGNNEETLIKIRAHDGRGLLLPDTFAEERLLLLPPAVCALLVLFNRNHNVRFRSSTSLLVIDSHVQYIANKLLEINERNTWTNPDRIPLSDPQRELKLASQDEELFQTARLINCTWFASIVFSDYFSCILGLVRQGNTWSLNPFGVRGYVLSFCSTVADYTLSGNPRIGSQAL